MTAEVQLAIIAAVAPTLAAVSGIVLQLIQFRRANEQREKLADKVATATDQQQIEKKVDKVIDLTNGNLQAAIREIAELKQEVRELKDRV